MSSLVGFNNVHLECTEFHIDGELNYNYAEFTLVQFYSNNSNASIDAKYVFPIISDIHLSELKIVKGDNSHIFNIQEPNKPLKSYQDAKNAGESDFLLKKLGDFDMMVFDIGEVAEGSEIKIDATYVCKSEQIIPENFWKFIIPKALFPNKLENVPCSAEITTIWGNESRKQKGEVNVKNGNSVTLDKNRHKVNFMNFSPENDIEVTYYQEIPNEPFIIVQKDEGTNRHAFYLSYKPDEELLDSSGAAQIGEFIILLDRSGSMCSRIQLATEAVALFIRSLPENCYFNVVSFGSSYEAMFKKSKKYDKCSADEAHRVVLQYNSNMGGTNLFEPLKYVIEGNRIPGYPLSVFVVTDGNVWDSLEEFKKLIGKHKDVKISTIGIDTDQAFIDNLAKMGNGTSQQIKSINQIKPAILSSLKQVLVSAITDIKLADYKPFDFVWPRDPFSVFSNEKIEISGVFKKGKLPKSITLQFQSEKLGSKDIELPIIDGQIVTSSSILVLEAKEYLKRCDKAESIKKSKEYQVEGEYTSFDAEKYQKTDLPPEVKPKAAPKKKVSNARTIAPTIGIKKPFRLRPGKLAEREIKKYQNSTDLLIPKTKFKNIVRTISNDTIPDMRFQKEAFQAFHEAAEAYIVDVFKASVNASANHKRMTVRPGDMQEAVIDVQQAGQNQQASPKRGKTRSGRATPAQIKPQAKRTAKKSIPRRSTTPRSSSSTKVSTPSAATPRTRSASKSTEVVLQAKRGRGKQAKVIPPQKKAKIEKSEAKNLPKQPQKKNEVKCIDVGYEVEKIMHLQNTDGYWETSANLSDIVNNLLDYYVDIFKFNEKSTTALVVALLEEKCKDYKCLWDLVVMKAKRWLGKNKQKLLKLSDF
ncbi:unnamed protein product [Blepharisma stoltei]|uniref:Uncharacterized protein n=1 Tax=Blepharisma stoltei TaxID=1481888 RepID=A0AAU9J823_9CILI|nr:unnamed protein product [Blepharisma stoltei]